MHFAFNWVLIKVQLGREAKSDQSYRVAYGALSH